MRKGQSQGDKGSPLHYTFIHFQCATSQASEAFGLPQLCWTFLPQVISSQNTPSALAMSKLQQNPTCRAQQKKTRKTNSKT